MSLKVIEYPSKYLKSKAIEITEINDDIKNLAKDMLETMYHYNGIGLAANQVGILKRIIVIDMQENEEKSPIILINPEIVEKEGEQEEKEEGCLSIPSIAAIVQRYATVKVSYLNLEGEKKEVEADGLFAICLQHEIDHLNGKLFIDRLSRIKRDLLIKKYKKFIITREEERQEQGNKEQE